MSRAPPPALIPRAPARTARAKAAAPIDEGAAAQTPLVDREGARAHLQLAIGKDGLGIELASPSQLDCLDIVELVVRLPRVKFPFDVSGGVTKFRHKRGELERVAIELDARRIARWAEPKLHGLLDVGPCTVLLVPRPFAISVTVHVRSTVGGESSRLHLPALAFDLAIVPSSADLSLVVCEARGAHLVEPATTLAIRAVAVVLDGIARREGARFFIDHPAAQITRALLPEAGVRAPAVDDMQLVGSGESDGVLFVAFVRGAHAAAIPEDATRAAEVARLTREGDDARVARDLHRARQLDVASLERAPRHPEIARRIAEIDSVVGGRAEAATATLREVVAPVHLGLLTGQLLRESGDLTGAIASLLRVGEREPSNVLSALAYAYAAELSSDAHDALSFLDTAVARAPGLAELRWERARRRLHAGRLADARADFQELEALAVGAPVKFGVLKRAADAYRTAGLGGEATALYERTLLYRPDDPDTLAGLGASLAAEGRPGRGAAILAHAIELAEARGSESAWIQFELACVLAERLSDRSAAVARLRGIPDASPHAIAARGLEGRLRAQLGDLNGASLSFARMRERAGRESGALAWLEEAARFETERCDLHAAQRHLAVALEIAPNQGALETKYREVSARIAAASGLRAPVVVSVPPSPPLDDVRAEPTSEAVSSTMHSLADPFLDHSLSDEDASAELRVESLTRTLQGDPNNDSVVDELVVLLTRLGRSMDLLALLSARLEDAPPDRREALLPRHREVLGTLEREARKAGRDAEADLFKMALEST